MSSSKKKKITGLHYFNGLITNMREDNNIYENLIYQVNDLKGKAFMLPKKTDFYYYLLLFFTIPIAGVILNKVFDPYYTVGYQRFVNVLLIICFCIFLYNKKGKTKRMIGYIFNQFDKDSQLFKDKNNRDAFLSNITPELIEYIKKNHPNEQLTPNFDIIRLYSKSESSAIFTFLIYYTLGFNLLEFYGNANKYYKLNFQEGQPFYQVLQYIEKNKQNYEKNTITTVEHSS